MTKAMRKYQKWLLAVFGSMLMVTFLLQSPGSQCSGDPRSMAIAEMHGRTVHLSELYHAEEVFSTLRGVAPSTMAQLGIESATHWLLLTEEAREGGFFGDARDGREFIPVVAQLELDALERGSLEVMFDLRQNPEKRAQYLQRIEETIRAKGISESKGRSGNDHTVRGLERAVAELRGVLRMRETDMRGVRLSDRAVAASLSGLTGEAVGDALVIEASKLTTTMPAPTAEQLEAHFQKHRSVDRESAPNGIGYVLSPRVKVEWLQLDRADVEKAVQLDPVAVNKHYMQNRAKYPGEFAAERARVEEELRDGVVTRAMSEADRAVKIAMQAAFRGVPEVEGFRTLPADWSQRRPSLEALASAIGEAIKNQSGLSVTPKVERRTAWFGEEDIPGMAGFGSASIQAGGRVVRMPDLLLGVKELAGKNASGLQVDVPLSTPAIDGAGNRYFVVVTATRAKGPAESLAEVRERAEKDWRTLAAYDKLKADAEALRTQAAEQGVDKLAQSLSANLPEDQKLTHRTRAAVTRDVFDPKRTTDPLQEAAVRTAVFGVADTIDPAKLPDASTAAARTIAVPLDDKLSLVVMRVEAVRPLTRERLHQLGSMNVLLLAQREVAPLTQAAENPYSLESLKKRLNYVPKRDTKDDEEKASETSASK